MNNKNYLNSIQAESDPEEPLRETIQYLLCEHFTNLLNWQLTYFRSKNGNKLIKTTEISYDDKIIRIEDIFVVDVKEKTDEKIKQMDSIQKRMKVPKSNDKIRLFHQAVGGKSEKSDKSEKKDKKNIVKNMIKLFSSWLEKNKLEHLSKTIEIAQQELKALLSEENFNNRLITSIIANDKINKAFLQFLTTDAEEQIKFSRIHDKQSHFQAINLYKKLMEGEPEKVDKLEEEMNGKEEEQNQDYYHEEQ